MLRSLFPDVYTRIPTKKKELFITFDDGPTPEVTHHTLEILKKYNAKATFFCLARNIERHPGIYNQIIEQGHATGNHTYSHLKGWKTSNKEYIDDIQLAAGFNSSHLFRPPYGKIKLKQIKLVKKLGYKIILWDVLSRDFSPRVSAKNCLKRVLRKTKKGSVIVFHDSLKTNDKLMYVLPKVLEHFSKKNYIFSPINITH